jgi:hypothetical protein
MNQEPQILGYENFDFNRLEYHDPLQTKGGSYVTNINFQLDDSKSIPIYIQTPRLKVVNGVVSTTRKTYIELELDSSDKSNLEFYNFLVKFDEINLRTCHRRSKSWFGQQFPLDDIDKSYDGPIKANRGHCPSIKLNLQTVRGHILTEIYNDKKQSTDSNYINEGDFVVAIIEIDGLKFGKSRFLFDMSVSQIKVFKEEVKSKLTGYHIKDERVNQVSFYPGQDNDDEYLSEVEDDERKKKSPNIDDSLYQNEDNEDNEDNENNENNEDDENNENNEDNENNDKDDVVNEAVYDGEVHYLKSEHNQELKANSNNVDYKFQKENKNNFVENAKQTTRLYFDDMEEELSTVNFGIDDSYYHEQVNGMRDNLRKLMSDYESYKEECQQNIEKYRQNIGENTEHYRELCHRYNINPEF